MNAVGIDVSKGKSTVAIMRPNGEVVQPPFEVVHTSSELSALAKQLKKLHGETKVIMEYTGTYYHPIAYELYEAGIFVSILHAQLIHKFSNDSIRKIKTDPKDAIKIANYGLEKWYKLRGWVPEEDLRRQLKIFSRQYNKYSKLRSMLINNFIGLTDQTFPGVNELFSSTPRKSDGHQKWLDFVMEFWHCECVCGGTPAAFEKRYEKWCKKAGYNFSKEKAWDVYVSACGHCCVLPKDSTTKLLMQQAIRQVHVISETLAVIAREMKSIAEQLPEYPIVMSFYGVGEILGPQLIAEIGDVYRFPKKGSLVCFAGLEAPPHQSGKFEAKERKISKKGSPHLRKTLFLVMSAVLRNAPADDPIFQFLDRKRAEGKHFYCYMTAGCAKFLRIYYARVKELQDKLEDEFEASELSV